MSEGLSPEYDKKTSHGNHLAVPWWVGLPNKDLKSSGGGSLWSS